MVPDIMKENDTFKGKKQTLACNQHQPSGCTDCQQIVNADLKRKVIWDNK